MTEDEETVLGDMISFFNDMGWIDDSTQEAYDSLCEKYCEPSPFDYEPYEVKKWTVDSTTETDSLRNVI